MKEEGRGAGPLPFFSLHPLFYLRFQTWVRTMGTGQRAREGGNEGHFAPPPLPTSFALFLYSPASYKKAKGRGEAEGRGGAFKLIAFSAQRINSAMQGKQKRKDFFYISIVLSPLSFPTSPLISSKGFFPLLFLSFPLLSPPLPSLSLLSAVKAGRQ